MLTADSHCGSWWTWTTFLYSIYVLLNIWCILIPVPAPPLLWPTNENKNKINYNWQLHRRSSLTAEHLSLCTSLISYGACRCICASSIHLLLVVCGQVGAAAGWARCFQLPSLHKAFWLFLRRSKDLFSAVSSGSALGFPPAGGSRKKPLKAVSQEASGSEAQTTSATLMCWSSDGVVTLGLLQSPDTNQDCHGIRFLLDDYCGQKNL